MNTIPQDEIEVNMQEQNENPDETAAVLAFATRLSEGLLPKNQSQPQETGATSDLNQKDEIETTKEEKAPEMEELPEKKEHKEEMKKEMESMMEKMKKEMKDEMKEMIEEEISTIKESIEDALNEDEEE